jgi:excisionase family DNA binding protein
VTFDFPDELLEAIAARAAQLVLERVQPAPGPVSAYLSVDEAAELLRAKPQRVYDLLSARRLTRFKDGARVLVSRTELENYLAGRVAPVLPPAPRSRTATRVRARAAKSE